MTKKKLTKKLTRNKDYSKYYVELKKNTCYFVSYKGDALVNVIYVYDVEHKKDHILNWHYNINANQIFGLTYNKEYLESGELIIKEITDKTDMAAIIDKTKSYVKSQIRFVNSILALNTSILSI